MSELDAPPPPGADTPVPADVVAAPRRRRASADAPDALVPTTAMQQRAERREADRRRRALPPPLANPMAGAVPPYVAAQQAWDAQRLAAQHAPSRHQPAPLSPAYLAHPGGFGWVPQRPTPPAFAAQPHPPVVLTVPPKRRLTRPQTRAALLGSLVGQALLALATHLFVTAMLVLLLWGSFSEGGTEGLDALEADSLTDVVAFWADPSRIPLTIVIVVLVTGAIAAAGCVTTWLWQRRHGLRGIGASTALAYVTTTVIAGFVGSVLWPISLIVALFTLVAGAASFTVGSMWGVLFVLLAVSVVLTSLVGMLFGWVYLLAFRPRPTWAQLEQEARQAEVDAERRAVAADAADLERVV